MRNREVWSKMEFLGSDDGVGKLPGSRGLWVFPLFLNVDFLLLCCWKSEVQEGEKKVWVVVGVLNSAIMDG